MQKFTTDDGEVITAADQAAGIVEHTASTEYIGVTSKVISLRIAQHLSVQVDALAQRSGKTRNFMIATLLEVGLEEVRQKLSDETIAELVHIEQALFHEAHTAQKRA